jgi:hypothetical protein
MPTVRAEVPMASQLVLAHPDNYGKRVGRFDYDLIVQHCTDGRSRAMPVAEMFATKRDTNLTTMIERDRLSKTMPGQTAAVTAARLGMLVH